MQTQNCACFNCNMNVINHKLKYISRFFPNSHVIRFMVDIYSTKISIFKNYILLHKIIFAQTLIPKSYQRARMNKVMVPTKTFYSSKL